MDKIAAGVVRFQKEIFEGRRALFEKLADGQTPRALFITCSDSRIDPNLMTQTQPGELFISRNTGNIIPPHTNHTGAMTAAIEYAVGALKVPHIIICGHSECGAMKGAMNADALADFPHVREWLGHARAANLIALHKGAGLDEKDRLDLLIRENVLLQIAHLKTHPYVALRVAAGEAKIHGWVYDIRSGSVLAYDEAAADFVPVEDYYRDAISSGKKRAR